METGTRVCAGGMRSDSLRASYARAEWLCSRGFTDILHASFMVLGSVFLMVYGE